LLIGMLNKKYHIFRIR